MKNTFTNKKLFLPKQISVFPPRKCMSLSGDVLGQKGFTLIETLITISLIAILSIVSILQLGNLMNAYRLSGAANLVWGDLQNAKMTAIKTNQSITVTFIPTTSYSFPKGGVTFTRDLSNEYPNISVSKTGGGSITFGSTGMTQGATVTLRGTTGTNTISITWTGRIIKS